MRQMLGQQKIGGCPTYNHQANGITSRPETWGQFMFLMLMLHHDFLRTRHAIGLGDTYAPFWCDIISLLSRLDVRHNHLATFIHNHEPDFVSGFYVLEHKI